MHEFDPALGWKSKPGRYSMGPYVKGGEKNTVTVLSGGSRAVYASGGQSDDRPLALVLGGSVTQGWAISDEDTFAWKLQQLLPAYQFRNYGTAGYGTYQSILLMEQAFEESGGAELVVYRFHASHEDRNVAASQYLRILMGYSARGHIAMPYALIGEDRKLQERGLIRYPYFPLAESSALVSLIQYKYADHFSKKRLKHSAEVTKRLLLRLNRSADAHGGKLVVAVLIEDPRNYDYINYMKAVGIEVVDCAQRLTGKYMLPGEGHPNGALNTLWAYCIGSHLSSREQSGGSENMAR